jgi:electron transport complex protein RnfC
MSKGVRIESHKKMSLNDKIDSFLTPKFVYIPLINQNDTNITTVVKKGDKVKVGTVIGKRKGMFRIPILSSVSGKVTGFCDKYTSNGKEVRCVVIENDFKNTSEKFKKYKNLSEISKEEFINSIRDAGIIGMGGGGFPTYFKYDTKDKINTLIINAVECEPYITSDHILLRERCEDILEAVDAILEINNIDKAIIVVKKSNKELLKLLKSYNNAYNNIKIDTMSNTYPNGYERRIIEEVLDKKYGNYPSEIGVIVNNVSTIYAIYNALKNGVPLVKRVVTFTGSGVKNKRNVEVLTGTLISDVIEYLGGYVEQEDDNLVMGGPMMGVSLPIDDAVITPNTNGVIVNDSETYKKQDCIKCGKCIEVCPSSLMPVMIMNNIKNKEKLKDFNPAGCTRCGLCSFMCPSKINLREVVLNAKRIVEENDEIQD